MGLNRYTKKDMKELFNIGKRILIISIALVVISIIYFNLVSSGFFNEIPNSLLSLTGAIAIFSLSFAFLVVLFWLYVYIRIKKDLINIG